MSALCSHSRSIIWQSLNKCKVTLRNTHVGGLQNHTCKLLKKMYKRQGAKTTFPWCTCTGLAVEKHLQLKRDWQLLWLKDAEKKQNKGREFKVGEAPRGPQEKDQSSCIQIPSTVELSLPSAGIITLRLAATFPALWQIREI